MVETVSSDSLGISLGLSHAGKNIGAPAMQGRSGERALVNAFTGNLVVQSTDDRLVGRGLDSATIRTYNSQGRLQDDDTDNWTSGVQSKRLEMTGAFAEPGSRIVRTDQDGARATYYFDDAAGSYRSTDGAGAYDRINMLAGLLAWTDGDTGVTETYQEGGAHLLTITDALGNTVRYTWHDGGESDGLLAQVKHASGESILLDYEGRNLIRVRTVMQDGDATRQLTRVHYGYDKHNRLSKVTVDLTPEDNAVTDSATYATTYTYDGDSRRIAGMTQADGTGLFFTYIETGGMSRVASVTDAAGQLTRYAYDSANRRTSVIDALGQTTLHEFDSAGRLVAITAPVVAGVPQTRRFAYDSAGDMVQSVDAEGHETAMEYDAAGNQIAMRGPAGHSTVRTFDALNQLLTETIAVPAEEGAPFLQTMRYLYDSARPTLLRFTLSAEGRVTEYRYNSLGERIAAIVYRGATYFNGAPPAGSSDLPAAGALAEWTAGQNRSLTLRTDLSYDFRGQLASETSYARVDASGNGIADGTQAVTRYVRDQAGQLLQSIAPGLGVTRYAWDGLGRLLSTTDALNQVSVNHYDDARNRTVVQLDGGRAATSVYDRAGRLAAIMVSNGPALNATRYFYDGGQRLTMTQDATGVRAWMLYDEAGRKIGDIDGDGSLSEYVYNRNDRIVRTISYATSIAVERLVDADGAPRALALADLRPAPGAQDRTTRADYDAANRLVRQIDARGAVTETRYDGGSRVGIVIAYATLLDMASADMAQGLIMPPPSADDRITRNFYDGDGLLRATVDAEGFRTELFYDGAGGLISRVSHGARTPASELSLRTHYVYDGLGRLSGEIDAEGYLSEHEYDVNGNLTKTVRYADRVTVPVTPEATVAALRPPAGPADQSMQRAYDAGNRLVREVNAEGSVTLHTYDGAGNLVRTIQAAGTEDARTLVARHDAQGRVIAELSGAGAAMLSGAEPGNDEATDALMAQYGTSTTYDAAGRRTSATDANGSRTVFYYDRDGRLTHTINALGEVSEQRYDTLGQRTDSIEYGTRIDPAHAVGGLVSGELEQLLAGALNPALDRHTRYGYDRNGRVASVTDALGNLTASTRDAFGAEVAVTETIDAGRSVQRQIRYDRRGLQIAAIEDPDGIRRTTVTAYDAFGRATALIDGNGNASFQEYDRLGRSVVRIDPMNGRRTTGYDAFGRVLSQTDATGSTTILRYDDTQRSVMVTTAEGITTGVIHTRHGQTARVIDGRGNVTEYSYDKNGNLLQTRNALATSASRYDQANRLIETVDANGTRVAYRYDAANRLLRRQFDPEGLNLVSSFEYDAGGRQVTATDANGTVTQTRFDRKGQAVSQTVDPAGLRLETRYVYDARGKTLSVTAPDGVLTAYVYDDLGRRIEEHVDPAGLNLTRRYRHDANGNVIAITDANGNTRRQVHDASDRLAYAIDALGGVTRNEYDAEGRISRVTAYAQAIDLASLGAQPSPERVRAAVDAVVSTAAPERDRVQRRFHDDDGRLEFTVDADGAVVRFSYDGNGNILRRTAYAIAVAPGMHPSSVAASAADRSTRMVYDHANRLVLSVDAQNGVTQQKFDGNGNLVMRIAYATPLAAGVSPESALSGAYEPGGETRITEIAYDRADRPVIEIDALGYVKQTRYDGVGRVVSGTRYAEALAAGAPGSRSALAAGLRPGMLDRTDMFRHDAGGRLTAGTDALGLTELSTYDAGGNRLSFTNRKGATWRYQYDAAGRLLGETSPEVAMTAVAADGAGALAIAGETVAALVTRIEHDALGNIVARTEAWGRPEQRTTRYRYDAVGRQIQTLYPAQAVYASAADDLAANGMNGPAVRTETTRQLSTETFYDALGNAVANRDVDGHLSYKAYDRLGRVAYDIDALGQVTAHTRNAFGDVTRLVRHEQAIAQDAVPTADLAAAGLGASDHDRVLLTSFDRLGRVLEVVEPAVFAHDFDAAMAARYEIAGARTRNTYNAFGELVQVSRLKNALADNWTATTHYFDRGGRNVATIDALGYLSTRRHDGAGNVVELTEYTNALGAGAWNIDRHEMPAVSADDRIMRITYDLDDRKLGETRGSAADSRASSTIRHEYDALGNLTRTIDAAGGQTVSRYDALGRVISVAEPERGNTADGAPLTPLTTFLRDAHGNAVVRISHARGTAGAAAADAADRAELTQYDMVGHITQSTNANGVTRYFSYDARGQVAKTWQQVSGEDGVVRTLYEAFRYDQLGRLTRILAPAAGLRQAVSETALEYNAFGELTRKGLDGGRQEFFDYDNAGRIWRTNSGDGVDRIMLHDLHGNVTAELRSAGSARDDLDLRTVVSAAQAASLAAVRRTDMRYDALGRMIAQVQPERQTQQGGVDFHRAFSVGAVAASAVPVFDATGTANWFGTNRVTLSWSSLAALGSGDVKVVVDYLTRPYETGGDTLVDESGVLIAPPTGHDAAARSRTAFHTAEQASSGISLSWDESVESYGKPGGISKVTGLTVYKKDVTGQWQSVIDQGRFGGTGNLIDLAAPADPSSLVMLALRRAGSAGDEGWTSQPLINFGDMLRFDASSLGVGSVEYRVFTTAPGQAARITASGILTLSAVPLAAISTPLSAGTAGPDLLTWEGPGDLTEQILRYRVSGSDAGWNSLAVTTRGNGQDGVNAAALAAGAYEFELLWSHAGDPAPYAHATGRLVVHGAAAGHDEMRNVAVRIPYTVTPPDPATYVTGWTGGPVYGPPVVIAHDAGGAEIFGPGYGRLIIGADESGNPIGGKVVAIPYQVYHAETRTETVQVVVPVQGEPIIIGHDESGASYYLRDESGNIIYRIISETRTETRTVEVQVPVTVTPADPALFLLSAHSGDPVYGPPVVLGHDEAGIPYYGPGYRMIDGQVRAIPYTATRTEMQMQKVWIATPGLMRSYAATVDTGAASAAASLGSATAVPAQAARIDGETRWNRPVVEQKVDRWGNVLEITDARNGAWTTRYGYNSASQLVRATGPDGAVTQYAYDALGRQTAVTDALGNVNSQVFDAGGNLVEERHADGGLIRYFYNAFGNRQMRIDAMGKTSTYAYDKLGQLLHIGRGAAAVYSADGAAMAVHQGVRAVTVSFSYDQAGRRLRQTNGNGEATRSVYDLAGNVLETILPSGLGTRNAYD
ncbi:MAG: LysM peptidoglycan-binding protein, partial [Herminiimonas sp.]|nr:LysM peptidoglycan-binding protein [Herminiimonas sp.]